MRQLTADDPGYGYVADGVPELGIAVLAGWRRRGVGRALIRALVADARIRGVRAVSLSVERANHAAHLYADEGFSVVSVLRRFRHNAAHAHVTWLSCSLSAHRHVRADRGWCGWWPPTGTGCRHRWRSGIRGADLGTLPSTTSKPAGPQPAALSRRLRPPSSSSKRSCLSARVAGASGRTAVRPRPPANLGRSGRNDVRSSSMRTRC